jgi:hypothetical protein
VGHHQQQLQPWLRSRQIIQPVNRKVGITITLTTGSSSSALPSVQAAWTAYHLGVGEAYNKHAHARRRFSYATCCSRYVLLESRLLKKSKKKKKKKGKEKRECRVRSYAICNDLWLIPTQYAAVSHWQV